MAKFVKAARLDDVPPGEMVAVTLGGRPIVLANVEGTVYAFGGICTHAEVPLGEGTLLGDIVECPFHGGQFNVKTGEAVGLPPVAPILTYQVQVDGNDIKVRCP